MNDNQNNSISFDELFKSASAGTLWLVTGSQVVTNDNQMMSSFSDQNNRFSYKRLDSIKQSGEKEKQAT